MQPTKGAITRKAIRPRIDQSEKPKISITGSPFTTRTVRTLRTRGRVLEEHLEEQRVHEIVHGLDAHALPEGVLVLFQYCW